MTTQTFKNRPSLQLTLSLEIIATFVFWLTANKFDVYKYAVVGAIYEILWLPMIGITFALPLAGIYFWYKERWRAVSPFLFIAIASTAPLLLYFFRTL